MGCLFGMPLIDEDGLQGGGEEGEGEVWVGWFHCTLALSRRLKYLMVIISF